MKIRERYQNGTLIKQRRKKCGAVWTLKWREKSADGKVIQRKDIIGTIEQYPTKAAAQKACEFLRSTINRDTRTPRTMNELVAHYTKNELPNKSPYGQSVYTGYIVTWITPRWGDSSLSDVRTVAVESWLSTLALADGSRAKVRNIMSALFAHAMRWEFFDKNTITLVRQSAKRKREPEVLTVDELKALLDELDGIYQTMVFTGGVVGLRISEILGLRWHDCDFNTGVINLSRGWVRGNESEMKTEASRKPVPMESGLAGVLLDWREQSAYNQPGDYIFASAKMKGTQPLWPNSVMEDHIRPAAIRAGIQKRIGWHCLRHTFGTLLKENGEDLKTIQSLMRHANVAVTADRYVQTVTPAKRAAQAGIVHRLQLVPKGA